MLLLLPAALLVMLVLAALVLDVGLSAVRARELRAVAAAAGNDSLAALDIETLRSEGRLTLDEAEVRRVVAETVAHGPLPDARIEVIEVSTDPLGRIEVTVQLGLTVELIVAPALPGAPDQIDVSATERVLMVP